MHVRVSQDGPRPHVSEDSAATCAARSRDAGTGRKRGAAKSKCRSANSSLSRSFPAACRHCQGRGLPRFAPATARMRRTRSTHMSGVSAGSLPANTGIERKTDQTGPFAFGVFRRSAPSARTRSGEPPNNRSACGAENPLIPAVQICGTTSETPQQEVGIACRRVRHTLTG